MKKLLLALLFLIPSQAFASFSYYRTITVDHTKVPSNQTNMTILVCANSASPCGTSIAGLNQSGGGAHVTQADGDDIVFGTNNTCTVLLNWDPLFYVAATGELIAWVEVGNLSSTVDDVFYMCYGDSGVTTFQGGSTGDAWHSSYKARHHLGDGSTLSLLDSTVNAADGTQGTISLTATAGKIDGAADGDGMENAFIGSSSSIVTGTSLAFGGWFSATDSMGGGGIFSKGTGAADDWIVYLGNGAGNYFCFLTTAGSGTVNVNTGVAFSSTMTRVVCSYDGSNLTAYVNGSNVGSTAATGNITNTMSSRVGWSDYAGGSQPVAGKMDETFVSNAAWSDNRETTEYNNQSAPGAFSAFGAENTPGGGGGGNGKLLILGLGK